MGGLNDEEAMRKHLKIFVGGLPAGAGRDQLGHHFGRYGQVLDVSLPRSGERHYGFVTFKFAADADCSVVDPQPFPGATRPLVVHSAHNKQKEESALALSDDDPCKVFVGGVGERDNEEEIGDFFSQWGLVILVNRNKGWSFVHFATRDGAQRLMEEGGVVFQRRRLDVKPATSKRGPMEAREKDELVRRAVARHFHKKSLGSANAVGFHPGYPAHPVGHPAPHPAPAAHPGAHPGAPAGYAYPGYAPSYPPAAAPAPSAAYSYPGGYYAAEAPRALEYRPAGSHDGRDRRDDPYAHRRDDPYRERRDDRGHPGYSSSADPYYRSAGPPPAVSSSHRGHSDPYARSGSRYQAY